MNQEIKDVTKIASGVTAGYLVAKALLWAFRVFVLFPICLALALAFIIAICVMIG